MLALGFVALNPTCDAASALTSEELEAGSLISSVSISFAPSAGSTTLSPTGAAGTSGLISVLANVGVTNSGGYSVYLGSNSTNLVGKNNASVVIPGVSGEVSFDNLQDNTWGYYAGEGSSIPENATYKAISQGQGDIILTNNNSRVKNENKTFVLGFAAKINNSIPADTYENQVTLSVVSNPYQLTLMDIDNMQDMTSQICENTPGLQTKQLKDVRDGKYYWVTKLADNKCWMTQNLDLDLGSEWPDASLSDYATASTAYKPVPTATIADSSTVDASSVSTRSWDFGEYVVKDPAVYDSCSINAEELSSCPNQFTNVAGLVQSKNANFYVLNGHQTTSTTEYDAHYLIGNYYSWNAVTAGTGGDLTSGYADGSICPKGWRLPRAIDSNEGFAGLLRAYSIGSDNIAQLYDSPLYFVRGGIIYQDYRLLRDLGRSGFYWTSTPTSNSVYAMDFGFWDITGVNAFIDNGARSFGLLVRCIAK